MAFLISAFLMGCLAAVPAGPVQIEVVRRSINGQFMPSVAVILGAFVVDVAYGYVALFGVAPVLSEEKVMAIFWFFGGLLLAALGGLIISKTLKHVEAVPAGGRLTKKRWGFITGLSLSVVNPVMIIWWLSLARIFEDVGLITDLTPETALPFIIAGGLGLASYLIVLSLAIFWAKKFISTEKVRQINIVFGGLLLLLSAYFILSSIAYFSKLITSG